MKKGQPVDINNPVTHKFISGVVNLLVRRIDQHTLRPVTTRQRLLPLCDHQETHETHF